MIEIISSHCNSGFSQWILFFRGRYVTVFPQSKINLHWIIKRKKKQNLLSSFLPRCHQSFMNIWMEIRDTKNERIEKLLSFTIVLFEKFEKAIKHDNKTLTKNTSRRLRMWWYKNYKTERKRWLRSERYRNNNTPLSLEDHSLQPYCILMAREWESVQRQ